MREVTGGVALLEEAHAAARQRLDRNDARGALDIYVEALRHNLDGVRSLSAADLFVIEQCADLCALLGQEETASLLLDVVAQACREAGNTEGADYATLKNAEASALRGDLEAARDAFASLAGTMGSLESMDLSPEGLARWQEETAWRRLDGAAFTMLVARACLAMAALLNGLGQYRAAIACASHGLGQTTNTMARAGLLVQRARAHAEAGAFDAALADVSATESLVDPARSPALALQRLTLDAQVAMTRGDFGRALRTLDAVTALALEQQLHGAAAAARLNRCQVLIALNQTRRAESEAAALAEAAPGDERLARSAAVIRELAAARRATGALALRESVASMQEGAARATEAGAARTRAAPRSWRAGFLSRFEDGALEVELQLASGAIGQARDALANLDARFGGSDSALIEAHLVALNALADAKSGAPDGDARLIEAAQRARAIGAKPRLWQCLRALETPEAALEAERLLGEMSSSLPEADRALYLINKGDAEEDALRRQALECVRTKQSLSQLTGGRRSAAGRALREQVETLCLSIDARGATAAEPIAAYRKRLRKQPGVTIAYLVFADFVAVLRVSRSEADIETAAMSRLALRDALAEWHQLAKLGVESQEAGAAIAETAAFRLQLLADALFVKHLPRNLPRHLRIAPDDALHGFPFAAAMRGKLAIVDKCALAVVRAIAPSARAPQRGRNGLVAGVGVALGEFSALPSVQGEIASVSGWMNKRGVRANVLRDAAAGKRAVLAAMPGVALLHIASHGVFAPDNPAQSGLVLPGPTPGTFDILSLADLAALDLNELRHATFTACSAADIYEAPGRSILSLPAVMNDAGCQSVLAPLWPVEDEVVQSFVARFLHHAKSARSDEALRRTQRECRRGRLPGQGANASQAFLWAAFCLFGQGVKLV